MANQTPKTSDQPKVAGSIPLPKSKRGLKGFISEVQREMKKVTWPTFDQVRNLMANEVIDASRWLLYQFEIEPNAACGDAA